MLFYSCLERVDIVLMDTPGCGIGYSRRGSGGPAMRSGSHAHAYAVESAWICEPIIVFSARIVGLGQ